MRLPRTEALRAAGGACLPHFVEVNRNVEELFFLQARRRKLRWLVANLRRHLILKSLQLTLKPRQFALIELCRWRLLTRSGLRGHARLHRLQQFPVARFLTA